MLRYFPCFLKNVIGLRNILIRGRDFGPQVESSRSFFPIYNRSLHTSNSQDLDKTESEVLAKLQESISEDYVPFQNQQRIIQDVIDEIWNPAPVSSHVEYKPSPEFLQSIVPQIKTKYRFDHNLITLFFMQEVRRVFLIWRN